MDRKKIAVRVQVGQTQRERMRVVMTLVCLGAWLLASEARSGPLADRGSSSQLPPAQEFNTVAGMPYDEAEAIVKRHQQELMQVPGVYDVAVGNEGILVAVFVYTNDKGEKPATLPPEIKALPAAIEGLPLKINPLYILPPPPGVIVLKPGGEQEQADACPAGYRETQDKGWRFCLDYGHPEPIPGILMTPPIAGIPYEEALKILERHRAELEALPGIGAVGMGGTGIYIQIEDPSVLPKEIEGLPLEVHPRPKERPRVNSHSMSTPVRPVGGGLWWSNAGTLAAAACHCGMWLIFPAHILPQCESPSPCIDSSVDQCLNRYSINNYIIHQPQGSPIGRVVKWTPLTPNTAVVDAAAAWVDNDFNQGNGSLCVDRHIEGWGNWTGDEFIPTVGQQLRMVSSQYSSGSSHVIPITVNEVDVPQFGVESQCSPSATVNYIHQVFFTTNGRPFLDGDSGSPIVTLDGRIVAMHMWSWPPGSLFYGQGGGTLARYVREAVGFTKWYGTTTFPYHTQVCQ